MKPTYTVDGLADAAMQASSSFNRRMDEAWTKHFRANAIIEGGYLHYLATRIPLKEIKVPAAIGYTLRHHGAVLVEGNLANHFEVAIPHIAAHLIDEYLERDSVYLRNPSSYRHYPVNEFLNPMKIFASGPLLNAQIDYEETVVWAQHMLWLKDTSFAEVCRVSLEGQTLDQVLVHPSCYPT